MRSRARGRRCGRRRRREASRSLPLHCCMHVVAAVFYKMHCIQEVGEIKGGEQVGSCTDEGASLPVLST